MDKRPAKCTLCAGPHKLKEHKYRVSGCQVGWGKICTHITATCANCLGNHQATSIKCPVRHKALGLGLFHVMKQAALPAESLPFRDFMPLVILLL